MHPDLQPDKHCQHQEPERDYKQKQLEENGFLEPFAKADVCKSQANEQRAAGRIQNVGIAVRKQVRENDHRFANSFNRRKRKHRDNQNGFCRRAGNEKLDNQDEYV